MIQYITDSSGARVSAVIPIELFNKLVEHSDIEELYDSVQDEAGPSDNVLYPNEVISIFSDKGCTMQAAWRIFRGMTQKQVADALGITQATVSEFEKSEKPRRENIERLSRLYNCLPEQLTLE